MLHATGVLQGQPAWPTASNRQLAEARQHATVDVAVAGAVGSYSKPQGLYSYIIHFTLHIASSCIPILPWFVASLARTHAHFIPAWPYHGACLICMAAFVSDHHVSFPRFCAAGPCPLLWLRHLIITCRLFGGDAHQSDRPTDRPHPSLPVRMRPERKGEKKTIHHFFISSLDCIAPHMYLTK